VNVRVDKFAPRNITGQVVAQNTQLSQIPLTLTGTNSTGTAVSQTVRTSADGSFAFNSLAPGNYMLKREALPFLNDQGQEVSIVSGATDGNFTTQLQVTGGLLAQYIDIRDFLGSTFKRTLTAVMRNDGTTQWIAPQGDWANLRSLSFQVNTTELTINAANATASNLTARVPLTNPLMSRSTSGEHQLIRLRGNSTRFNLAPPTTPTTNNTPPATLNGEGEAATGSLTSASLTPATSGNRLVGEGEASAAPAVNAGSSSAVDSPALSSSPNSVSGSPNNVLLSMLGSSRQRQQTTVDSSSSVSSAIAVDEAMKDVQPTLRRSVGSSLLNLIASSRRR
jgi:hypothetical protein